MRCEPPTAPISPSDPVLRDPTVRRSLRYRRDLGSLLRGLFMPGRVVEAERARLAAIPFPFAHVGYFDLMRRASGTMTLKLHVEFAKAPDRERIRTTIDEDDVRATVEWEDSTHAIVVSPIVDTHHEGYMSGSGQVSAPDWEDASAVHAWFVERALPFLERLHQAVGIVSVGVSR